MRALLLCLLAAGIAACGRTPKDKTAEAAARPDGVEVLSFHAKKRCPTCIAVEQLTCEVVENRFAAQLADGSLRLSVVDISEQEALADRYEVAWSALLVTRREGGRETVDDLTRFAFANARTNPEAFKTELRARIVKLLGE